MKAPDLHNTDRRTLAQMFSAGAAPQRLWRSEELADVLAHQLRVPVEFDLSAFDTALAAKLGKLAAAQGLLIKSFDDLLRHPHPPVELLILTKDFAKRCAEHAESALPQEVARVLYYLAIAAAIVRCQQRITSLSDAELRASLEWGAAQPWVGETARGLLQEAMKALAEGGTR